MISECLKVSLAAHQWLPTDKLNCPSVAPLSASLTAHQCLLSSIFWPPISGYLLAILAAPSMVVHCFTLTAHQQLPTDPPLLPIIH